MKVTKIITVASALLLVGACSQNSLHKENSKSAIVENYANIVLASYQDSLIEAKKLQVAIDKFLADPSPISLENAKKAWLKARVPYLQTEAYRFYEGPIDFESHRSDETGPEARINAWPLNEAYIDYVKGDKNAGIINDKSLPISIETLKEKNQQKDEGDVSTGYHAIEFLLWGQDLSNKFAGNRQYNDYLPNNETNLRRRLYLKETTQLLIEDLQYLINAWQKDQINYRKELIEMSSNKALGKILSGAASMAGNEFANERINNALISGDQEDEQSCFSDNTKNDYIYNFKGIKNIYFGKYENVSGSSISDLLAKKDSELNNKIVTEINSLEKLIENIDTPFDSKVLASKTDSAEKQKMRDIVERLHKLGDLLVQAGDVLGAKAIIVSE